MPRGVSLRIDQLHNREMGFYSDHIQPILIDRVMQNEVMADYRPRLPRLARGRVLDIGSGSGLNIPHYGAEVKHLFGLEPSTKLNDRARTRAGRAPFPVEFIEAGAEDIPLEKDSVDTIVSTWTLCSIPEIELALQEMRRVLKPGGLFLFMEHGIAADAPVVRLQKMMAPLFRALAGCNPDRQIDRLVEDAGFVINRLELGYLDGPRFLAYHYIGEARP